MVSTFQEAMAQLPEQDQMLVLAVTLVLNRVGSLPPEDRDDLFELLQEWREEADKDERANIKAAMMEILTGQPLTASRMEPAAAGPPGQSLAVYCGNKVKELRKAAGLTQEQLAEKSGIGQSHVCRIEKGEHCPNALTRQKLAKALGVDARQLDPTAD